MTPAEFLDALRAYCAATSGSVTSYGRTPKHNHAVGGVAASAHLLWLAADVVYDPGTDRATRGPLAERVGLVLIIEDDHDHLQAPR